MITLPASQMGNALTRLVIVVVALFLFGPVFGLAGVALGFALRAVFRRDRSEAKGQAVTARR